MKIKVLLMAMAASVGLALFAADPLNSQVAVQPGQWTSSFTTAQQYAYDNNIPMVVLWANPGCSQCEHLEDACLTPDFQAWQASRNIIMVFAYGKTTKDQKAAYDWLKATAKEKKTSLKSYPFVGVYWRSNGNGQEVKGVAVGRKGQLGQSSSLPLQTQFMNYLDTVFAGWSGSGEYTPVVPQEPTGPDPDEVYASARTLTALAYSGNDLAGTATLKLAKISKKGLVKVSLTIAPFGGTKATATVSVTPDASCNLKGSLPFKAKAGNAMSFVVKYDAGKFLFAGQNDSYKVAIADFKLGGPFAEDQAFAVDFGTFGLPEGYELAADLPFGEPVHVKNGTTWTFDKAASVKYVKDGKAYKLVVDKGVNGDKTNVSALKLTYKSATGAFSGTFKVFAKKESAKGRPTLKTYTAKVSGVVVDGTGYGAVTVKTDKTYVGDCWVTCPTCLDLAK